MADRITGADAQRIEQDINRQFTLAHLADLIAAQIGREQTIALSSALVRFVRLITLDVNGMARPSIKEIGGDEVDALRFGAASPWVSDVLLPNLAIAETDAAWKETIVAATIPWDVSFQHVGVQYLISRSAAGLAQDILDVHGAEDSARYEIHRRLVSESNSNYLRASHLEPGTELEMLFESLDTGITIRRSIVRDFPSSPTAHINLGSFLGMAGKWMRRRDLVDEGITEVQNRINVTS